MTAQLELTSLFPDLKSQTWNFGLRFLGSLLLNFPLLPRPHSCKFVKSVSSQPSFRPSVVRRPHGSPGLPPGLLEKRPNVYAGPPGFPGFYPQVCPPSSHSCPLPHFAFCIWDVTTDLESSRLHFLRGGAS